MNFMMNKPLLHDLRKHPFIAAAIPLLFIAAIYYRWVYIDHVSGDMWAFVKPWMWFIRQYGLDNAYSYAFSNYMPLYTYMLGIGDWLMTPLNWPEHYIAKAISIAGDFTLAYFTYRIITLWKPERNDMAWLGVALIMASPTVLGNSSVLAQCDTWYTAFSLAGLYALMTKRYCQSLFWAGIAYSFKQQAMFIWPFLFIFVLNKQYSWKWLWVAPAAILLTLIPAWLEGRRFMELLMIYFAQAGTYEAWGNAPNLYWLMPGYTREGMIMCLLATALVCFTFAYVTAARWRDTDNLVKFMLLATFSVTLSAFILPKMLDRYFYSADVFSIILVMLMPRWFMMTVLLHIATIFSYPNWYYEIVRKFMDIEWFTSSTQYGSVFTGSALLMQFVLCYRHIWQRDPVPLSITGWDILTLCKARYQESRNKRRSEASAA